MFGMRAKDDPTEVRSRATAVPRGDRACSVYCDLHGTKRRLVAVVTKQGRLVTDSEDVSWVAPPYDRVLAPCRLCPMTVVGVSVLGHGVTAGGRSLSVSKLRELYGGKTRTLRLENVLHEADRVGPAGRVGRERRALP